MKEEWSVWAQKTCDQQLYVMHLPTKRVGQIVRWKSGGEYVSPINHVPVEDVVVELTTGDSFVANPDHFVLLSKQETKFYEAVSKALRAALGEIGSLGIALQIDAKMAAFMTATAMRMQASALVGPPEEPEDETPAA